MSTKKMPDWAQKRANTTRLEALASPWVDQLPDAITVAMAARCVTVLRAERARTRRIIRQQQGWELVAGIQGLTTTADGRYIERDDLLRRLK